MVSTGFEPELVRERGEEVGLQNLSQPAHGSQSHADDPSPAIPPRIRRQAEPLSQSIHEELDLPQLEAVGLERRSSVIRCPVVHEPTRSRTAGIGSSRCLEGRSSFAHGRSGNATP